MSAGLRSGVALRPATSAMEARDALLYLAREHMRCMTSESQTRFEKCVEFVEMGVMPAECLATVAQSILQKQKLKANKSPKTSLTDVSLRSDGGNQGAQSSQPDVTLRSGGRSNFFLGKVTSPSDSSGGAPLWSDVMKNGQWLPLNSDMWYDEATAQWKVYRPYRRQSHVTGKRRGKSKGKKRGKGFFQKGRLSGDEDEALANLCRFLQANPTYVFEPRPVESSFLELYQETGEMNQVLLKQMQRHLIGKPDELRHVLEQMASGSHWRVDQMNHLERERQQRRQFDHDGKSSVSGWSFLSGASTTPLQ